ncbi:MAG TPA: DoxX family protein [Puia sp.]
MFKRLLTSRIHLENWLILIRVITGIIIAKYGLETFNKGQMEGNVAWLKDVHFPSPFFMAYLGKISELIGGILLILGLLTRVVSIVLIINMSVIIFIMGHGKVFGEDQLPFLLLLLFATFLFSGAGKWSLDHLLFSR